MSVKYKKVSQREHILIRPDTYVGSIEKEKRPLATRIIGDEQFSGCIMQPHYFVIIKLNN